MANESDRQTERDANRRILDEFARDARTVAHRNGGYLDEEDGMIYVLDDPATDTYEDEDSRIVIGATLRPFAEDDVRQSQHGYFSASIWNGEVEWDGDFAFTPDGA